jgi:hypothetical protein
MKDKRQKQAWTTFETIATRGTNRIAVDIVVTGVMG